MKLKFQVASAHGKGYLKTVNPKPSIIMTFEQTDTLIDSYFGEEISEYELRYTVEAACQEQTSGSVSFLKAYFADGIERRDAGRIECALVLAGLLGKDRQLLGLYETLLLADWHHSHEDIVASLEEEGNASNVPVLQQAFSLKLPHMAYNGHYSFHRKLLYAIRKLAPQQFPQIYKTVRNQLCAELRNGF